MTKYNLNANYILEDETELVNPQWTLEEFTVSQKFHFVQLSVRLSVSGQQDNVRQVHQFPIPANTDFCMTNAELEQKIINNCSGFELSTEI